MRTDLMELRTFIKEIASAPRVSGTEGEQRALDYLEKSVEGIGFSVRREDFSFQASLPQGSHLQVGNVRYEVLPVGYSKPGQVSGPIAFIESLEAEMLEGLRGPYCSLPRLLLREKRL
jgi:hypothetical protein